MKSLPIIFSLCFICSAHAQKLEPEAQPDEFPESLLETKLTESDKSPEKVAAEVVEPKVKEVKESKVPSLDERPDAQPTPDEGISIQQEKPKKGTGGAQASGNVKVYSPWPAKPMFPAPSGWKFAAAPEGVDSFRTKVKLSTGQEVSLAITPFVLVPVTDGLSSIRITEPGYQPELGFAQRNTVGVMLQESNADLERNEQQAAVSIRRLQQLLSSLPKTPAGSSPTQPSTEAVTQP